MSTRNISSDEALRMSLKARQEIHGRLSDADVNYEVARNILHEELGYIGERRPPYNLDEDTRDILVAHGRHDAAHALSNTVSMMREQKRQGRLVLAAVILLAYLAAVITWSIIHR